jgi:uncharacterized membrane protein YcjF (UPF0283 family)
MEDTFTKAEELVSEVKEYINIKLDALKLTVAEKISRIAAVIIAGAVVAVAVLFFVIFLSISLAYLLGEIFGSVWLGFLTVAGLYLLIGLIIWSGKRKMIQIPIMNSILAQWNLKEEEEDEED